MKTRFESLSGFSFDDVRVHYNSDKPAQLQALAYTQGNQIHIASGQEKHLSHELAHVVQQKQVMVKPMKMLNGVGTNDNLVLKKEADSLVNKNLGNNNKILQEALPFNNDGIIQKYSMVGSDKMSENGEAIVTVHGGLHIRNTVSKEPIVTIIKRSGLDVFFAASFPSYLHLLTKQPDIGMQQKELMTKFKIPETIRFLDKLLGYNPLSVADIKKELNSLPTSSPVFDLLRQVCFSSAFHEDTEDSSVLKTSLIGLERYLFSVFYSRKPFLTNDCGELATLLANGGKMLIIQGDMKSEYGARYHVAYPIFKDGNDEVTMEAADVSIAGRFNKLDIEDECMDNSWRFEMYGNNEGQTFKDAHQYLFSGNIKSGRTKQLPK